MRINTRYNYNKPKPPERLKYSTYQAKLQPLYYIVSIVTKVTSFKIDAGKLNFAETREHFTGLVLLCRILHSNTIVPNLS